MRSLITGIGGIICMWLSSLCAMFAFLSGFAAVIRLITFLCGPRIGATVCHIPSPFLQFLQFLAFASWTSFFAALSYGALVVAKQLLKDESQLKAPVQSLSVLAMLKQKSRRLSPFHIRLAAICTAFFAGAIWTLAR